MAMLIQEKIGTLTDFAVGDREIDHLPVEWYETAKRILRKSSRAGHDLALRFLRESPALAEGDILYAGDKFVVVVEILPCDAISIVATTPASLAAACYEIGNRHLPLFLEGDELLVPFEEPLFRWLTANSYNPVRTSRKLLHPLRSTVTAHAHAGDAGPSLLTRILNLTANP
jgi:urease accessory protein